MPCTINESRCVRDPEKIRAILDDVERLYARWLNEGILTMEQLKQAYIDNEAEYQKRQLEKQNSNQ